jgi:hypothetical protein
MQALNGKRSMFRLIAAVAICFGPGPTALAMAGGPFDGTYAGSTTATQNDTTYGLCDGIMRDNAAITIKDNTLHYYWGPVPLKTSVAPDGSFTARGQPIWGWYSNILLRGKISGQTIEAAAGNVYCAAILSFRKM